MNSNINQKSVIIYTRHGLKQYNNGKAPLGLPQHDSPLIPTEFSRIENLQNKLLNLYGQPNRVMTSPFKRTRQTTEGLIQGLSVEPEVDSNIGEYLGNQKPIYTTIPDVTETTSKYKLPKLGEKFEDMKSRCRNHLAAMGFIDKKPVPGVTWVVSHGLIIETIVAHLKRWQAKTSIPDDLDMNELDSIVVVYDGDVLNISYLQQ